MSEKSLVLLPERRSVVAERAPAPVEKVLCIGKTEARFCGKAVVLPDQPPTCETFISHTWEIYFPLMGCEFTLSGNQLRLWE